MKKFFALLAIAGSLTACNDSTSGSSTNPDSMSTRSVTTDTTSMSNPVSADTSSMHATDNMSTGVNKDSAK